MLSTTDLITFGIAIAAYFLEAFALYTIAKRREINNPWLAWIPVAGVWILGSISDQYYYVTKREIKNMRKVLLGLNIAVTALAIVLFAVIISIAAEVTLSSIGLVTGVLPGSNNTEMEGLLEAIYDHFGVLLGTSLGLIGVSIATMICTWIALNGLFLSCDPANATTYLVVSILGGFVISGIQAVFVMICRNKDLGMPPRREEPIPEYQPEEPWVQE